MSSASRLRVFAAVVSRGQRAAPLLVLACMARLAAAGCPRTVLVHGPDPTWVVASACGFHFVTAILCNLRRAQQRARQAVGEKRAMLMGVDHLDGPIRGCVKPERGRGGCIAWWLGGNYGILRPRSAMSPSPGELQDGFAVDSRDFFQFLSKTRCAIAWGLLLSVV